MFHIVLQTSIVFKIRNDVQSLKKVYIYNDACINNTTELISINYKNNIC